MWLCSLSQFIPTGELSEVSGGLCRRSNQSVQKVPISDTPPSPAPPADCQCHGHGRFASFAKGTVTGGTGKGEVSQIGMFSISGCLSPSSSSSQSLTRLQGPHFKSTCLSAASSIMFSSTFLAQTWLNVPQDILIANFGPPRPTEFHELALDVVEGQSLHSF